MARPVTRMWRAIDVPAALTGARIGDYLTSSF
jgi:hypothetical protein